MIARKKRNIRVIVLTFPGMEVLKRIQRRKYVRVSASIDIAVKADSNSFPTVSQDISGGGIMIVQPHWDSLKEYEVAFLTMVLPINSGEYHYVEAAGKVIRVIPATSTQPDKASIYFKEILEKDRQLMIRYCFEQQMQMRMIALK